MNIRKKYYKKKYKILKRIWKVWYFFERKYHRKVWEAKRKEVDMFKKQYDKQMKIRED